MVTQITSKHETGTTKRKRDDRITLTCHSGSLSTSSTLETPALGLVCRERVDVEIDGEFSPDDLLCGIRDV
ncbi:hypothetical protein LBMAG51_06610 [Phycisphaerae bacterium]|nr:hypothetical protein LBMAG51_06610 [Phycisphaerae bacterium]